MAHLNWFLFSNETLWDESIKDYRNQNWFNPIAELQVGATNSGRRGDEEAKVWIEKKLKYS